MKRSLALAMQRHSYSMMTGCCMGGMMVSTTLSSLVVIGALIAGVWWLASRYRGRGPAPLDILRERYARGEISREEFEAKKRDLA